MKRDGFLIFLLLLILTGSGCTRLDRKEINYSGLVAATKNIHNWTMRTKQSTEIKRATRVVKKSAKTQEQISSSLKKLNVAKVQPLLVRALDFSKLKVDRVARRSSAIRRSIIKPLVLELKSFDSKDVEYEKPIRKNIIDSGSEKIKAENKKRNRKIRAKKDKGIEEIASGEIVKIKPIAVKIEDNFKVASLLDTVRFDGNRKIAAYLQEEAQKEIGRLAKIAEVEESKKEEDHVKTELAASIKLDELDTVAIAEESTPRQEVSTQEKEKRIQVAVPEKALFDKPKTITAEAQGSLSSIVKQVIDREMQKPVTKRAIYAANVSTHSSPSAMVDTLRDSRGSNEMESNPCEAEGSEVFSRVDLFGYSGGDLGKNRTSITNFEFIPRYGEYDEEDRRGDSNGLITFCKDLNDGHSLMAGTIKKDGYIDGSILINFGEGFQRINVPLIERERFGKFISEYSLDERMSAILVEKYDDIVDIKIDSLDSIKLELNAHLELIEEQSEKAEFILFLNVEPRNILITYLLDSKKDKFVEKLIFAPSGKVFFDEPIMREKREKSYDRLVLTQRNIAGVVASELEISGNDLTYFNTKIKGKKIDLNRFELKIPKGLKKMRNYVELSHLGKVVDVGYAGNLNLELPGDEFINYSLDKIGVDREMRQQCVVQVNLRKNKVIQDSVIDAHNANGPLYSRKYYFDTDGIYYEDEWSNKTTKIFIASELTQLNRNSVATGSVSIKLKYTDGTSDYMQTFCSNKTYLVEQL